MTTATKAPNESKFPLDELEAVALFLRDNGFFVVRKNAITDDYAYAMLSLAEREFRNR